MVFLPFSPLSLTESCSSTKRSRHSAHVSGQSWHWPLKPMTSQAVEGTWICTGGYGRFRGEWVDNMYIMASNLTDNSQRLQDDIINIKRSFIPLPPRLNISTPTPTVPGSPEVLGGIDIILTWNRFRGSLGTTSSTPVRFWTRPMTFCASLSQRFTT